MSKVESVSVIASLSFCMIVGALVFSRGFLLNRQIVHETAGPCRRHSSSPSPSDSVHIRHGPEKDDVHIPKTNEEDDIDGLSGMANWCNPSPSFPKLVLVLVDALRFDFVQRMEFLSGILSHNNNNNKASSHHQTKPATTSTCAFKFVADPPTTTMQRLKALMTGTMPTFIDASANFNSYEVEEDSLIYQLYSIGKRIAFLGDDTWLSLFPQKYFKSRFVEAHPSFNAWDLDTVDKAVNKTMQEIFLNPNKNDWDILISHLLGVDHCGHRYGPNHPEMARKLHEADSIIKHVFNSMSDDTLLVVFGDHGMTATGDHGGDSKDETESAVIFISKQFQKYNNLPLFQCTSSSSSEQQQEPLSISQIDLVPTLALLLGIPIPYSNIGQVIPSFLQNKINSDAIASNVAQVNKYIQHFPSMLTTHLDSSSSVISSEEHNNMNMNNDDDKKQQHNLVQQYKSIQAAFKVYKSFPNTTSRERLQQMSKIYLKHVKSIAVSTWTQFNLPMIYVGILITFLSVFSLFIYLTSVPLSLKTSRKQSRSIVSVLSWLLPSLAHWSVLCTFVYHSVSSSALVGIVVSTLSGLVPFVLYHVSKLVYQSNHNNSGKAIISFSFCNVFTMVKKHFPNILSIGLYVFTCLSVFSNSFTVYEGHVLAFILSLVALIELVGSAGKKITFEHGSHSKSIITSTTTFDNLNQFTAIKKFFKCSWSCFIIFLAILRISYTFFRCREEQTTCTEEYLLHKQLASLPGDWLVHKYLRYGISLLVLAIFAVSFRHWMIYRSCIFSKKPRAIIGRFIPSLLVVLLGVFWALQGLPYISLYAPKIPLLMNYLPLVYQGVTMSAIICVAFKPICCIGHLKHLPYATNFNNKIIHQSNSKAAHANGINNGSRNSSSRTTTMNGDVFNNTTTTTTRRTSTIIPFPFDIDGVKLCDCFSEDTYSSCFLTLASLITLLLVQITSAGLAPAIILEAYAYVCIVGIFRKPTIKDSDSWSSAVVWTLTSQYFFYATGHQPIFSAIPWDSAFVGGGDGSNLAAGPGAWVAWIRAGLAVVGNLHVSQILSSISLPLLVYWSVGERRESLMGKAERQKAYILYGKYLALHGLKLLLCMACAGWHRRHLMVWKIFAPKFIFEAMSFIVTSCVSLLGMVFLTRVSYCHQKFLDFSQTA